MSSQKRPHINMRSSIYALMSHSPSDIISLYKSKGRRITWTHFTSQCCAICIRMAGVYNLFYRNITMYKRFVVAVYYYHHGHSPRKCIWIIITFLLHHQIQDHTYSLVSFAHIRLIYLHALITTTINIIHA